MQCPLESSEVAISLLDYCARKLDPSKAAILEGHLSVCGSCREAVRSQRVVWEALEAWDGIEVPPRFNRQLYARIDGESQRSFASRWWSMVLARWSPVSLRSAVPAAIACCTVLAALCIQQPGASTLNLQEAQAKVERMDLEQVERTLQDLDMLNQLSPKVASEPTSSSSI